MNQKYYLLAILILLIALTVMYVEKPSGHYQQMERLESVIRESKREADSLHTIVDKIKDSLDIAFATIKSLNIQREVAHQETQKWVKRYNRSRSEVAAIQPQIDSLAKRDTIVMTLDVAYHLCDSTATAQANEIEVQGKQLIANDSALTMSQNGFKASQTEASNLREALTNTEKLSEQKAKQARKKGFRRGLLLGASIVGVLFLL